MKPAVLSAFLFFYIATVCNAVCKNGITEKGVPASDIKAIVDKHNEFRKMIMDGKVPGQPKGSNLKTLKWDDSLAGEAQKIAETCEFQHVKVTDSRFPGSAVGQNLGWEASSNEKKGANWGKIVQSWFDEHKDYHYPDNSKSNTGHYTQVVWGDTTSIGCGYVSYKGDKYPSTPFEKLYVCNYGPAGNWRGKAPYQKA